MAEHGAFTTYEHLSGLISMMRSDAPRYEDECFEVGAPILAHMYQDLALRSLDAAGYCVTRYGPSKELEGALLHASWTRDLDYAMITTSHVRTAIPLEIGTAGRITTVLDQHESRGLTLGFGLERSGRRIGFDGFHPHPFNDTTLESYHRWIASAQVEEFLKR